MSAFLVQLHVEREFPGIVFNPERWDTIDGYIPWRLFLRYAAALYPVWAMERLRLAASIGLAFASDPKGHQIRDQAVAEAYPELGPG
jgi:hypothetical protein